VPTIEVPGHGLVEFPDDMSEDQIVKAIERDLSPVSQSGPFGRAVGRAWEQEKGLGLEGLPAMVGRAVGADEYADRKLEEYSDRMARAQRVYPADVPSFTDIGGLGDAGTYIVEAVGEGLVSMGPSLLMGGVGGVGAKFVASKVGRGIVENAVARGATKEAAETAVARATERAVKGGIAGGAGVASAAQNIPETFVEATGGQDVGAALVGGGIKSVMDMAPQMRLLGNLFGREVAEKAILKRIGKEAGKQFGFEGATEAAQDATDIAVENYMDRNPEMFSKENLIRVVDAGLKGGISGGVAGGARAVLKRGPRQAAEPSVADSATSNITPDQATEILTAYGQDPANFTDPVAAAQKVLGTSIQRSIERQSAADVEYLENLAKLQKSKAWKLADPMKRLALIEDPRRAIEQEMDADGERPTRATSPETTGNEQFVQTPQGTVKRDDSFAGQLGQAVNAPTGTGRFRVQRVDDEGQPVLIIVDTEKQGDGRIAKQTRLEKGQDLAGLLKKFEDEAKYRNDKWEEHQKLMKGVAPVNPYTQPMTPQETDVADTFGFNNFKSKGGKSAAETKEALGRMAKLFGVPADALGLGGVLSFEVKQPSAGVLGDFHPRDKKMRGDNESTVVHEWVHAIDNHFNKLYGRDGKNYIPGKDLPANWGMLTAGEIRKTGEDLARPEIEVAWHNLMAALEGAKKFKKDAQALGGGYWSSPWERLARAAQAYMGEKAGEHTPLGKYHRGYSKANPKLFPHGDERTKIGHALENFFAVMKERPKQTPRGTPATELYRLGEPGSDAVADVRKIIRDAARQVLGPELSKRVSIVDRLDQIEGEPSVAADGAQGTPIGRYTPAKKLIEIALNQSADQLPNTVYHEAFHMLEKLGLFGYDEAMVLERDAAALKSFLGSAIKKLGWDKDGLDVNGIARIPEELRAYAFEAYTALRNQNAPTPGLTGALRRLFERGYQFLRKLANGLRGNGYQNYADVFDRVASGEVAARKPAQDRGEFTGFYLRQSGDQELNRISSTMADDVKAAMTGDKGDPVAFANDIGLFEKIFNHPTFLADKYPALRPLVGALGKIRAMRNQLLYGLQEDFRPFLELPAESKLRVETAADMFNQARTEPRMAGDQVIAPDGTVLKGAEAKALMAMRKGLNGVWDNYLEAVKKSLGDDADPGLLAELAARKNSGYLPQMRFGNIGFRVVDKSSGETVWFQTIEPSKIPGQTGRNITQRRVNAIRARLKKEKFSDANFEVEPAFELTRDSWKDKNILDAVGLVEATMMAFNLGKDADTKAVLDEIQKKLKTKGFRANLAKRKNVPGYINDENRGNYLTRTLPTYAARSSHYISREMHAPELRESTAALKGLPKLKKYAEELISYSHSPNEEQQFMKNVAFHWLLGFNVSSAAINLTQIMHATLPYLSMMGGPGKAAKEVTKAFKDAVSVVNLMKEGGINWNRKPPGITDEEWRGMQKAHEEGLIVPVNTQDLTGMAQGDYGSFVPTIGIKGVQTMEIMMRAFTTVENINRITTWLAARRLAADPAVRAKAQKTLSKTRWSGEEKTPDLLARAAVEDTQFVMGKENRPEFMRGMMALPTQFMSFPVQMLEQWIKAAKYYGGDGIFSTGPGKTMLALMALGVMATAGVWGLPFAEPTKKAVEAIYKLVTGGRLDVDKEMREAIVAAGLDKNWGEAVSKGLGRFAGIDVSKRTSLEIVPTDLFSGNVRDALGPTGAVTLGSIADAHERFKQGQNVLGFAALMPTFLKNAITARENLRQGVVTGQGNVLLPPDKVGAGQALTKGLLGFTPAPEAQARELVAARQGLTEGVKDLRESYTDRLTKARREAQIASQRQDAGGSQAAMEEFRKLLQETREYDKGRKPEERLNINLRTVGDRVKRDLAGLANKDQVKKIAKNARQAARELSNIYPGGSE
jgi:hypothetical protein